MIVITDVSSGTSRYPWEYPVFIWKYANINQSYLAHLTDVQLNPTEQQPFTHRSSQKFFLFFFFLLSLTRSAEKLAMDFLYEIFHISSIFSWADANYIEHVSDKYIYL